MKDHVAITKKLDLYGTPEDVLQYIKEECEGVINPFIDRVWDYDEPTIVLRGYRPMTEKEIARAKHAREASRKAREIERKKKEEQERAELKRLKEKYE